MLFWNKLHVQQDANWVVKTLNVKSTEKKKDDSGAKQMYLRLILCESNWQPIIMQCITHIYLDTN